MGIISAANQNLFKSADKLYSKIKRQWSSFNNANLLDDSDFPEYIAEVLNLLGIGALKEEEAVITVKNSKACLPKGFKQLYAAYKCSGCNYDYDMPEDKHFQYKKVIENDITCEVLGRNTNCNINCECPDRIIERVTVKQYVNDGCVTRTYKQPTLLRLSPNVKDKASEGCLSLMTSAQDEITINGNFIYTNFNDGDIYLKYHAFPLDDDGMPMIPDIKEVEFACEWYIKWQLLLNYWFTDDLPNAQNKWAKAEQEYNKWFAEARYILKLPSFSTLVNSMRTLRSSSLISTLSRNTFN